MAAPITEPDRACRSPQGERGLKLTVCSTRRITPMSLPARGAWVETKRTTLWKTARPRRSPQGERGLKHGVHERREGADASLPARGAWVETSFFRSALSPSASLPARGAWVETHRQGTTRTSRTRRSPQGERGLKPTATRPSRAASSRSPQGERGLKRRRGDQEHGRDIVAPRKGSVG